MQEYFKATHCQLADSKLDRKAITEFKQLLLLLSMAAESVMAVMIRFSAIAQDVPRAG